MLVRIAASREKARNPLTASGTQIPSSLLLMLPYFLTIAVLVFSSWLRGKTDEPEALGTNIEPAD